MKITSLLGGVALLTLIAAPVVADTYVNGYTRSDGTYVQPHYRSSPDSNPYNNYSTRGNTNPYTGQAGTTNPYSLGSGSGLGSSYRSPYTGR